MTGIDPQYEIRTQIIGSNSGFLLIRRERYLEELEATDRFNRLTEEGHTVALIKKTPDLNYPTGVFREILKETEDFDVHERLTVATV